MIKFNKDKLAALTRSLIEDKRKEEAKKLMLLNPNLGKKKYMC